MAEHKTVSHSQLIITSRADAAWPGQSHNPADFTVNMTNTVKTTRIVAVVPTMIAIPRMFPTISKYNNVLIMWQRKVIEVPSGLPAPNDWLRTVSNQWSPVVSITLPVGILNVDQIIAIINPLVSGLGQVWSFNTTTLNLVCNVTAPGAPAQAFGYFTGGPTGINAYAPMTLLSGGSSESMTTLGLQPLLWGVPSGFTDPHGFDPVNPSSFDAVAGSNLAGAMVLELFNRESHSYTDWITNNYQTPQLQPPNLAGPTVVHCTVSDLGDLSHVDASTGTTYDAVKTCMIATVPYGETFREVLKDVDAEKIDFKHQRSVTGFRVRLLDSAFRGLVLPPNCEVNLDLTLWYQDD